MHGAAANGHASANPGRHWDGNVARFQPVALKQVAPLVMIVDPDAGDRRQLETLAQQGGFRSRSLAGGEEALAAARRERPHVAIMDVGLGELSAYEVCERLRDEHGDAVAIMFVSADRTEPRDRAAGLRLGADDYMVKPLEGEEVLARIRALLRRAAQDQRPPARKSDLTTRELEVLQLLAHGLDQRAIAEQLVIAHRTVGKHIEHILAKLSAHSRAEAVSIAFRRGLYAPG